MLIQNLKDPGDLTNLISGKTLVDFYADWCGPCKSLASNLEKLSKDSDNNLESITILKVNIENFQDIAQKYNIRSLPTMLFMKNSEVVKTKVGSPPYNDLVKMVKEVYHDTE